MSERSHRKDLVGVVIGRTGDKTIKVAYAYKAPHPMYKKEMKRRTILHAHDEVNECQCGDKVELMETRPLSRLKRWRVIRVVSKSPQLGGSKKV
jgi:small subunit ribosomal protein S17